MKLPQNAGHIPHGETGKSTSKHNDVYALLSSSKSYKYAIQETMAQSEIQIPNIT